MLNNSYTFKQLCYQCVFFYYIIYFLHHLHRGMSSASDFHVVSIDI